MNVPKISIQQEDAWEPCEEDFSEEFLKYFLDTEDLSATTYVELQVDAECQSIEGLGVRLPRLELLKLNGSHIPRVRDLGTQLQQLRVLWLARVGLCDLDGISVLSNLQELYVAFNNLTDASPLSYHDQLEVVDLEGNCLESAESVGEALGTCWNLRTLTIQSNPCAKNTGQLQKLRKMLPSVEIINDCNDLEFDEELESTNCSSQNHPESAPPEGEPDEQELIILNIKQSRRSFLGTSLSARPGTAFAGFRPPTRDWHPTTAPAGGRPWTAVLPRVDETSAASSLTSGAPLAGPAFRAIRQKKQSEPSEKETIQDLLQRFKTFTQESSLSEEELARRMARSSKGRPPTPDVRVHTRAKRTPDEVLPQPTATTEKGEMLLL